MSDNDADADLRLSLMLAYRGFIRGFGMTHTGTFNFGPGVGYYDAIYKMKGWCTRIERIANGRNWHRFREDRLAVVAFPEHLETNRHWHGIFRAPSRRLFAAVETEYARVWENLEPKGQFHMGHPRSLIRIAKYFTKELPIPGRIERVFVYAGDVHPDPVNR